ncbi:nucleotide-binding universal stress UspA family protein [Salegentibacter sp. 24]|jgi:nucleotide-binding universal stress UspA family protein|uniref:universal stress protein n=1 Tax=Salegentibacter sp. 24 TaxID=2183986 RepID=UPI00105FE255|nr:universal stress protein [Salegentibacter sp. 24]TDN84745.1 nucleotide-binding universal stress UspA family protein [Salegentibacter sp. 24]
MEKFSNILVALDLSDIDDSLIKYASFLADKLKVKKVYFVHNIKKYEISALFDEQLKDINLDEIIGDELNEKVEQKFDSEVQWEVLISEDPYTESLINYIANKYYIDLVIVGNKNRKKGTGIISNKLLRLLKCDILSVPRNFHPEIKTIWAGTDFSRESRKIFNIAQMLQEATSAPVTAAHVYSVPVQFSPYLPKETMAPKIEKHAREKGEKFLSKLNYKGTVTTLIIPGRDSSVARNLLDGTKKNNVDILIVADKGANHISSLLVGSVTEELFGESPELPLWISK